MFPTILINTVIGYLIVYECKGSIQISRLKQYIFPLLLTLTVVDISLIASYCRLLLRNV